MTNLTERERDAVVSYLFSCETAFLVANLIGLMPEDDLKKLGQRLVADLEEYEKEGDE